jgi:hypothetical protein
MYRIRLILMAALLAVFAPSQPMAAGYNYEDGANFTVENFKAWLDENRDAQPQFVDGDVITEAERHLTDPFVPPGLQMADMYGEPVTIKDAGDLTPPQHFIDATKKFFGQASIDANGALQNYTAGTPFDRTKFVPGSMEDGFRAMWNYDFRYQHYGLYLHKNDWIWAERGGNHDKHEIMKNPETGKYYGGGGTFSRNLHLRYQKILCMNLTMPGHPEQGYTFDDKWCEGVQWREFSDFWHPFDIAGTGFIVQRYKDPYKTDDAWAYIPSLRRVRRVSVEVKADSLVGTEDTLEDFYGFAGRVLEWTWEFLGSKKILAISRSRYPYPYFGGPNGITAIDDWALREVDVVIGTPNRKSHPYSKKIIMFDSQNSIPWYSEAYDRGGILWKVWRIPSVWTEDPHFENGTKHETDNPFTGAHDPTPEGTRMCTFQGIDVFNMQNGRSTLIPSREGIGYPVVEVKTGKRILNINRLTQGR